MVNRKQKIEELLGGMRSLMRSTAFKSVKSFKMPQITPSQWGALMLIEQYGETSVKDLANALRISSSATTQLVDGLVKSGYVQRAENPKDRRTLTLTLSKKTKNRVEKMKGHMVKRFLEVFEVLTDKEFDQFCSLHKKIVQRFSSKN